jgi:hypothetical protein
MQGQPGKGDTRNSLRMNADGAFGNDTGLTRLPPWLGSRA